MRLLFTLLFIIPFCAFSQVGEGGRATGLAGTSVCLSDGWSVFHNQAGLTQVKGWEAGAFFQNRFLVENLGDRGIYAASKAGSGVLAGSYQSFGVPGFNQSRVGLAYALPLSDKFSIGVQANYHSLRIAEGYGISRSFSAEGGIIYKLNDALILGAHIENINRPKLSEFTEERMPSTIRIGAGYIFSQKVKLLGQIHQELNQKLQVSSGIEYDIAESVIVRIGAASQPGLWTLGFGWKSKYIRADLSSSYHAILGFTPQVSLVYSSAGF